MILYRNRRLFRIRHAAATLALVFLLAAPIAALSEVTPEPTPVEYGRFNEAQPNREDKVYLGLYCSIVGDDNGAAQDLYQVRQTLQHGGYYKTNVSPHYGTAMLDQNDLDAIQEYWFRHTGSNYPTGLGLTYGALDMILTPLTPTQPPHEYKDIPWQQGSEDLNDILERLYDLKYITDRSHQVYDAEVREAIRAFAANNGFPTYYDNDTEEDIRPITVDLQRELLETDINNLHEATVQESEKISYFLRKVKIGSMQVPMLVLWGVGLVVLVGGMLLVIYLFVPSEKKNQEKQEKRIVHFTIVYNGKSQVIDVEITKALKIGRGVGNFPLNLEDTQISRKHCELYYLNDALMLRDYSSNGTTVNDKIVHNAETLLSSGDKIVIGSHVITIKF